MRFLLVGICCGIEGGLHPPAGHPRFLQSVPIGNDAATKEQREPRDKSTEPELGNVLIGGFHDTEVQRILELSDQEKYACVILVGVPRAP